MDTKMMFILMLCIRALNTGLVAGLIYTGEHDKVVNGTLFRAVTARSAITCCATCSQNKRFCKAVNFNEGTGECEMVNTHYLVDFTTIGIDKPGWSMHYREGSCGDEDGWMKYRSSCYILIDSEYLHGWSNCLDNCRNMLIGARIWFIDDPGECDFIKSRTLHLAPNIFPIDFWFSQDAATGCMTEQAYKAFPSHTSYCIPKMTYDSPYYADGNLVTHSRDVTNVTRTCVCEKRQRYPIDWT